MRHLRSHLIAGQSIIELIVAMGLFSIAFSSMMTLVMYTRNLVLQQRQATFATEYAREGLEAVRLLRDQNWTNIPDGQYGLAKNGSNWQFSGTSDTSNGFTRTVLITATSANIKSVMSKVTWVGQSSRTPVVKMQTLLTNWKTTQQSNFISGDWAHPIQAGSSDIESGAAGTDVLAQGNTVYLSSKHAQIAKVDFSTFDVTTPASPQILSSQDMGINNLSALAKSGNYVYASIANSTDEIMVLDVTNPASPTKIKSFPIPNSNGVALSIAVNGTTLFVGMQQISGESELFAIDVSNPLTPSVIGSFEIGGDVASIAIFNNRAYLATSLDTGELMILDIADPTNMKKLGQYDAPGAENGLNVYVKDEYNVYLGRQQSNSANEFNVLNASNPATVTLTGSFNLDAGINDMVIVNHLAFLATDKSGAELEILEIGNPQAMSLLSSLNVSQVGTGIAFTNNTVYMALRSNTALKIIKSG